MSQLMDFINHIKRNNIARSNRYMFNIALPEKLLNLLNTGNNIDTSGQGKTGIEKVLSLTCLMADIPGYNETTSNVDYGNLPRKTVHGKSQGDFTTTFLVSGNFMEKKLFDVWHFIIMNENNTSFEYYDNYIANIKVDCLNTQDLSAYSFELLEAYPIAVSALKLDRNGQNQQMVLDVTWAYHKVEIYMSKDITKAPSATPTGIGVTATGTNRQSPVSALSSFSQSVHNAMDTVKGFKDQLQGALNTVQNVKNQIRDAQMQVLDGIKMVNGVVKDIRSIANIPTDVKNEVVGALQATKNQLGSLKADTKLITAPFPKR